MPRQSEQLEREAEETRARLAGALDELRFRLTPGQVLDEVADYVRDGPAAEFVRNLAREIRDNPIPVLLIAAGIGWLVIASTRRLRLAAEFDNDMKMAAARAQIGPALVTPAERWPEQRAEEVSPLGV
jgi:hypothetical protein